jgi:hypothetical protein
MNTTLEILNINDVFRDYQQKLFEDIIDMKYGMQRLASFVQNDFNGMLNDGVIEKDDIKTGIVDMDKSFDEKIKMLNILRERCRIIMSHCCE